MYDTNDYEDTEAYDAFIELNPEPLEIGEDEDGSIYMVEEWWDSDEDDALCYVLEYFATPDGESAIAYCRECPWELEPGDWLAGHVRDEDGFLCLGSEAVASLDDSPYDIEYVVLRARYWTTAFTWYKQHGSFPNPR